MATTPQQLSLQGIDGHKVDKIAVAFSGKVYLDMADPNDLALWKALKLGSDVSLKVEGSVAKKEAGYTTSKEGDLDAVVDSRRVKVHTVYVPQSGES